MSRRIAAIASLLLASSLANAGPATPIDVPGEEVIHVYGRHRAVTPPHLKSDPELVPPYSDDAILSDAWVKAWVWLDVDENGVVERVKFIRRPGHDLAKAALEFAFSRQFEAARDGFGQPSRSYVVFPIEWPSHEWLISKKRSSRRLVNATDLVGRANNGTTTTANMPPCAGSGPLQLDAVYPVYRDCYVPDLAHADGSEPWLTRSSI
ncbi:MAG TPA: energy transducer TonB [Kofleriaceae bacterium]